MALDLTVTYSGKVAAASTSYPQGEARNVTTSGDGTGTPWDEDLINDWLGFFQSLLSAASVTPSGDPDTVLASDYYDALTSIISAGVGAWQFPTLSANCTNTTGDEVRYRLIDGGQSVEIAGSAAVNASGGASAFTLPTGFRPVDTYRTHITSYVSAGDYDVALTSITAVGLVSVTVSSETIFFSVRFPITAT